MLQNKVECAWKEADLVTEVAHGACQIQFSAKKCIQQT